MPESLEVARGVDPVDTRDGASLLGVIGRCAGVERQRAGSPEGSGLSICGDRSDERRRGLLDLAEDGSRGFSRASLPGDDQSELSFYRRLLRQPRDDAGDDGERRQPAPDCLRRTFRRLELGPRSAFRPYTLQDYRCIGGSPARLDRSLAPDPAHLAAKRECLVRRRSYGDAASALNRQRISSAAKKQEARDFAGAGGGESSQSCMPGADVVVAPAEITEDVSKVVKKREAEPLQLRGSERPVKTRSCNQSRRSVAERPPAKTSSITKATTTTPTTTTTTTLARKSKSVLLPKTPCSLLRAEKVRTRDPRDAEKEKPSLQSLRTRHFNEKRMIDQLIKRSMLV